MLTQNLSWSLLLMAPFGATMVLLYALPQSPLAQPKNIFFGHLLTCALGLLLLHSLGVSPLTLGLGTGLGVGLMMLTNTTHPPAGAQPLAGDAGRGRLAVFANACGFGVAADPRFRLGLSQEPVYQGDQQA